MIKMPETGNPGKPAWNGFICAGDDRTGTPIGTHKSDNCFD